MPAPAALFAMLLFSLIGFAAFLYGKRAVNVSYMAIGAALMGYTYFVSDTLLLYLIGAALCGALYWFRG
ncbi:hypothetical protein [Uliginosibacterium gangwonense]|uniref:hypothetical protein n=1 Tax=Uliginosibacterium gangwonense TaxID=392736 RepID=UPI00036F999C|nr:hypothetical protein [Uliginosibacterium gangwonense]